MPKDELDLDSVTSAVTEVKQAFEALKGKVDERDKELLRKGDVDVLITDHIDRINTEISAKQEQIDDLFVKMQARDRQADADPDEVKSAQLFFHSLPDRNRKKFEGEWNVDHMTEYKNAYTAFLENGREELSAVQLKALSVGSDPEGGYVTSPDMSGRIVNFIYETSPMRQFASVTTTDSPSLEGIMDLDEAASGWVGEKSSRTETDTPDLKEWSIPVHELYAEPRATQKILDDANISIEEWLAGKVAAKMARDEATAFVSGNGVSKPRGFTTYDAGTTVPGTMERLYTGVDGNFAADPAGADKLIDLITALKVPYRSNANFFMSRVTQGGVRLLKDSDGRMMWQPSLAAGQPSTLLGFPVVSMDDMAAYTVTDALAIAFGDMRETYQIVERQGTRILRDPYTSKPYVKFYTTRRCGGDVINFESMKLLQFGSA